MIKYLLPLLLCFSCVNEQQLEREKQIRTSEFNEIVKKFEEKQGIKPGSSSCDIEVSDYSTDCSAVMLGNTPNNVTVNIPVNFSCIRSTKTCHWINI